MGEITTSCYVDIPGTAREVIRSIGYDRAKYGFDCETCGVITNIDGQSPTLRWVPTMRLPVPVIRHDVRLCLR